MTTYGRGIYPSYFFKDHDPVIDYVRTAMAQTGTTPAKLVADRACSHATTRNWGLGKKQDIKVRRPSFATVASVLRSMGVDEIRLGAVLGETRRNRIRLVGGKR